MLRGVSHSSAATKLFSTWVFPFTKRTYVRTWASESRWDAGIRDSTYDCKFVNALDTVLARYPPSIEKPNVSHILALFTRRNCSANFCQCLERCEAKSADPSCLSSFRRNYWFLRNVLLHWLGSFYFERGDASLGGKKLHRALLLSSDKTLAEARLKFQGEIIRSKRISCFGQRSRALRSNWFDNRVAIIAIRVKKWWSVFYRSGGCIGRRRRSWSTGKLLF